MALDVVFHGVAFNLHVSVYREAEQDALAVDLEELGTDNRWHGEFSAGFVETMTGKTGSFKAFDVFVKMLQGALWQQSDTVFVDLLTFADLVRIGRHIGRGRHAATAALDRTLARARAHHNFHPPPLAGVVKGAAARRRRDRRAHAAAGRVAGRVRAQPEAVPHPHLRRRV